MLSRLALKRTKRNLLSKHKHYLRNRGMSPQWRTGRTPWRQVRDQVASANSISLRGVHADLRSTIPVSAMPKRQSRVVEFFHRLLPRKGK